MEHKKEGNFIRKWWKLCPARHVLLILGILLIALFYILRKFPNAVSFIYSKIVRPYHLAAASFFDKVSFSVTELVLVTFFGLLLIYLIISIFLLIFKKNRLRRLYRMLITLLCCGLLVFGCYCHLWGTYYFVSDFEKESGIEGRPSTPDELHDVCMYFAERVNEYAECVERGSDNVCSENIEDIWAGAASLYEEVVQKVPCLRGAAFKPKPLKLSKGLSYMGYTGFFFPFTGEANLNTDGPKAYIPVTVAHELAHQRGVAAEDEANFVAVLACMEHDDPIYRYSAALLAYVELANALYSADYDLWHECYSTICDEARADMSANSAYWKQFDGPVQEASDKIYDNFLKSNKQELGLRSYGACVDLLVAYYLDEAQQ